MHMINDKVSNCSFGQFVSSIIRASLSKIILTPIWVLCRTDGRCRWHREEDVNLVWQQDGSLLTDAAPTKEQSYLASILLLVTGVQFWLQHMLQIIECQPGVSINCE